MFLPLEVPMKRFPLFLLSCFSIILPIFSGNGLASAQTSSSRIDDVQTDGYVTNFYPEIYKHGDCSWVPLIASFAGWKKTDIPRLLKIIARESGCCPNRRGGDKVDKNCNITGVSEWNHRSDSGLTQLNGVHWLPTHKFYHGLFCKKAYICTQEPLLDPYTNLKMAKLLFDEVGWSPWSPITK
jgi:hypothetical protein